MILYGLACWALGVFTLAALQIGAVKLIIYRSLHPMGPLALLKFISPTGWVAIVGGFVIAFAGVQTLRLDHAKADQFDRGACTDKACKGVKWKDEVSQLRPALVQARADLVQCQSNRAALQASIDAQNADVDRWKAAATSAQAESAKALSIAQAATATASKRVAGILAAKPGADACKSAEDLINGSLR